MRSSATLFLLAAFLFKPSFVAHAKEEIALRSDYRLAGESLTTERIWALDPSEANPHRQRWVIARDVRLIGLRAQARPPNARAGKRRVTRYRVVADEIRSETTGWLRSEGPWYRPFAQFPCSPEPLAWFSTRQGALAAAASAAESWAKELDSRRFRLSMMLERVAEDSEDAAVVLGEQVFENWLREAQLEWAVKGRQGARMAEWRAYLEEAGKQGLCKKRGAVVEVSPPRWREMMEPPAAVTPEEEKGLGRMLARAPARRWNGLFSVRLSVDAAGKTLNGKFLVDSGAAVSLMSPSWLEGQGVNPVLLEIPGASSQRVVWSRGSGLARKIRVFDVRLGGQTVPLKDYLLMETELFSPPDHLASCCDGILGADFLRLFAVEFRPGPPSELILWPREGFSRGTALPWVEVASLPTGEPASSCSAVSGSWARIDGVRWDTGSEAALDIHTPWQSLVRKAGKSWDLVCDNVEVAEAVPISLPEAEGSSDPFRARSPGTNAGIALLARGPFIFDLGHGRLWFDPKGLSEPVDVNRSGLEVEYVTNSEGDRELKVSGIQPRSPAAALAKAGLTSGMKLTEIDSHPVGDLDIWEVEQRLAGAYGKQVTIAWRTKAGLKVAPLEVR